jgi:hypothetical protein
MQVNPHYELYRVSRAQANEVYLSVYMRGPFNQIYPGLPCWFREPESFPISERGNGERPLLV